MSNDPVLAVEPEVSRFATYEDGASLDELLELLQAQRDTAPVAIRAPEEVLLNHEGLIQQNYRLTTTALQQLCSVLAPGLTDVVRNIAGLKPRTKQFAHEEHSFEQAIDLLNRVIRFRFDLLEGHSFIMDRRHRQIAGVVGPKYRFLSNAEMFTRVDEFLRSRVSAVRFWEAAVAGRRLLLRYRSQERTFSLATPLSTREPFYTCVHFSNSELGDCCVKGSAVLYRQWSKTAAIMPFSDATKLVHFRGEKFNTRFGGILERIAELVPEIAALEPHVCKLQSENLGLGGKAEEHKQRLAEIATAMAKGGISRKIATDALTRALVHGSYKTETVQVGRGQTIVEMLSPDILRMFRRRTTYDVLNGLCHVARSQSPAQQEAAEQRAYDIIIGKISLT